MSKLTTITLDSVAFYPVKVDVNGVASLRARGDTVADSSTISLQTRSSRTTAATKVTARLAIPYWFAPKGDTNKKQRETLRAEVSVVLPPNATLAQRQDVYNKLKAFIGDANFKTAVEHLESLF